MSYPPMIGFSIPWKFSPSKVSHYGYVMCDINLLKIAFISWHNAFKYVLSCWFYNRRMSLKTHAYGIILQMAKQGEEISADIDEPTCTL